MTPKVKILPQTCAYFSYWYETSAETCPTHAAFLRGVHSFQAKGYDLLRAQECLYHYFRRGEVAFLQGIFLFLSLPHFSGLFQQFQHLERPFCIFCLECQSTYLESLSYLGYSNYLFREPNGMGHYFLYLKIFQVSVEFQNFLYSQIQ